MIQVKASKVAGEGVFVLKGVGTGKTLLVLERPQHAALDNPKVPEVCSNCFAWSEETPGLEVKACVGCHVLRYCSKVRHPDSG